MSILYKPLLSIFLIINTVFLVNAQIYELNENFNNNVDAGFTGGSPNIVLMDSNGKYIVAGDFTAYNGTSREGLVRLNADGTLDTGFGDLSATFSGASITDMEIDASDNIYISGTFADEVLKIDNTGTIEGGFNFSRANLSVGGTIQELGLDEQLSKLYIGQEVNGDIEIAQHLSSTGVEDNDFTVRTLTGSSASVGDIEVDNNNDVYIVGRFNSVGIFSPINIARFDYLTGDFDQNFVPNYAQYIISSRPIEQIELNSNGDVYTIQNTSSAGVVFTKYQSDGTYIDDNFVSTTGTAPVELTDLIVEENDNYFFISGEFGVVYGDPATLSKTDFFVGNNFKSSTTSNVKSILYNETSDEFIAVGDFDIYGGKTANTIAKLGLCESITINTEPEIENACVGESRDISVDASGTGLTYQWQVNTNSGSGLYTDLSDDATYTNTNSNTLSINNITTSLASNQYRVIISDGNCEKTSQSDVLFVIENPTFTEQPEDVSACEFEDGIEFSFTLTGNTQNLQWQVKSTEEEEFIDLSNSLTYTGANSFTLKVDNINIDMDGNQYRVIAGGCETDVISAPATLTVNPAPEFSIGEGSEVALCDNGDISLTATSANTNLTYRWQIYNLNTSSYEDLANGGIYSGVNSHTLQITGADNSMDHINGSGTVLYKCIATNSSTNCEGENTTRLIIVDSEPSRNRITSQPTNVTECDTNGNGRSIGFSLQADLANGETLQWQVDSLDGNGFIDIDGEKNTSVTFTAQKKYSDLQYRAIVFPCEIATDTVKAIIDELPEVTISEDIETCENSQSIFVVESDQPNVSYQWEYLSSNSYITLTEDNNHSGVNNDTLKITNNSGAMNRLYRCVVTSENGLCEKATQDSRLIVYSDPNFNASMSTGDLILCEGISGRIDRRLSSSDGINANFLSFQWQYSEDGVTFNDLSNSDIYRNVAERDLIIDSAAFSLDSNYYRLVVRGCENEFYSDTSQLFIEEEPTITAQPEDQTICFDQDEEAVFTLGTTGDNIDIFWERSLTIDGNYDFYQNTDTLVFDGNNISNFDLDGYYFRARVVNGNNCQQTIYSDSVQFNMNEVTLLEDPISEVDVTGNLLCLESETYLYVNTRGESLNFQWQVDEGNGFVDLAESENYSSVNDDTLRFKVTDENLNFNYQCIISGLCESITTSDFNISGTVVQSDIPIIESNRLENGDVELFVQNISYNSLIWYDEDGNQLSTQERPLVNSTGIYSVEAILNGCGFMSEPFEVTQTILGVNDPFTVSLFPNPVANKLSVQLNEGGFNSSKLMVYDLNGSLLREKNIRGNTFEFSLEDLNAGIFYLIIENEKGMIKRKFIKE
ncbi:MAG: T9SS type A sorting domain-containing protein [Bacteroidota bacterium]